jgi:hypothetical protein
MLDELWNRFKGSGYSGSVSTRSGADLDKPRFTEKSDSGEDDSFIHEAIYEMDPDYVAVCIIRSGFTGDKDSLPTIDAEGWQSDKELASESLDKAILEGLAHKKAFVIKGSGAVVKFGYEGDTIV